MKKHILIVIACLVSLITLAQPDIAWQKSFGGSEDDQARSIKQTADGGYIVVGLTRSNDGDVSDNNISARSIWVVKLDASGNLQWEKSYGGNDYEEANEIQQTSDGGYIVIGSSKSIDFIGTNIGDQDIIIFKLDTNGDYIWGKRFGGTGLDSGYSIKQTTDGGYIASGKVNYPGNLANLWVAKLDVNGDIAANWSNTQFYGVNNEVALSVNQTTDGGYIVAGTADFDTGNNMDFWIFKLDATSNVVWQNTYGGSGIEWARDVQQTSDGGYMIVGSTASNDGDVSNNYGQSDFWVLKLDVSGNIEWEKNYGGSQFDVAFSVQQTADGGYVIAGETSSDDNDVSGNPGSNIYDYWVIKITATGVLSWQTCLGGSSNDFGKSIQQTSDNGFIVTGQAFSNNWDVSGNNGRYDFWVVKLSPETLAVSLNSIDPALVIYPNPVKHKIYIKTDLNISNLALYDAIGKQVLSQKTIKVINVDHLETGLYLLKIETDKGSIIKKIIIN